ncbi:MAG: hypothetical protein JXQ27_14070 [Acidobacteria bacterium]|nr:hypothetical protein [Acidobacteriota bacterium]
MRKLNPVILSLILIAAPGLLTRAADDHASAGDASRLALARECQQKLFELQERQARQPVVISNDELNAYLVENQDDIFNSAARDVRVRLQENRMTFRAIANLKKANLKLDSFLANAFMWIFSGDHQVEATILFQSDNYRGRYEVESLRIRGIPIPGLLVESLAGQVGHRQRPPMVPGEPFELPYNLKRCDIVSGALVCYPGWQ